MRRVLFMIFSVSLLMAAAWACGKPKPSPEVIAEGHELFIKNCSSCHGKDARGLPKNGKDLVTSEFVYKHSDEELLAYVHRGRPVDDPLNTTGVAMPPKGGNPALSDEEIKKIIAFVRTINGV